MFLLKPCVWSGLDGAHLKGATVWIYELVFVGLLRWGDAMARRLSKRRRELLCVVVVIRHPINLHKDLIHEPISSSEG